LTNRLQISLGSSGTRHLTICTFPLKQLSNMLFFSLVSIPQRQAMIEIIKQIQQI
jgi:hypothetical protein